MPTLREVPDPERDPTNGPSNAGVPPNPRDRDDDDPHGVDLWIMPYILDSSLRPVLIVIMAHVVAFVTPVLLMAVRDRSPGPIVGLMILIALTARGFRYEKTTRGFNGAITWVLCAIWVFAAIAAYIADSMGIF